MYLKFGKYFSKIITNQFIEKNTTKEDFSIDGVMMNI